MAESYSFKDVQCSVVGPDGRIMELGSGVPDEGIKVEMPIDGWKIASSHITQGTIAAPEMREWDGHKVSVAEYECLKSIHDLYVRIYGKEPKAGELEFFSVAGVEPVLRAAETKPLETVTVTVAPPPGHIREWQGYRITEDEYQRIQGLTTEHAGLGTIYCIEGRRYEVTRLPVLHEPAFVAVEEPPAEPAGESQAERIARITREMCGG